MSVQITEFIFLSQLSHRFSLPVPEFATADAGRIEIREKMEKWGGRGVVKADIMTGGRGKAGAVKVVNDTQSAMRELKRLAGIEIKGKQARTSYLTQFIEAKHQIYTAITYDSRYLGPSLTVSLEGGVDIESVNPDKIRTIPINVFKGLDAYQASDILTELGLEKNLISIMSRTLVNFWDMFISTGMRMAEINPWHIADDNCPYACDFKAVFDEANFKARNKSLVLPEYPDSTTEFEDEMARWSAASHQGQAHVSELGGSKVLPILFGGGASTIITETLEIAGGSPIFLSDFGGNPPYERMYGTVERCFKYYLNKARLLLILGGKANNTMIDITFQAIADALINYVEKHGRIDIPVIIGRGGPRMVPGFIIIRETLEALRMPYVIFGPDTPLTLVAEYAAKFAKFISTDKE